MRFTHLRLENWRNFKRVDLFLQRRVFLVGPNASGKSNLLDAFRFLRDVARPQGGGFQAAVGERQGISSLRSLFARQQPNIAIEIEAELGEDAWRYRLEFGQDNQRTPVVKLETVHRNGEELLRRPDGEDRTDPARLRETHLEQTTANRHFRDLADFFAQLRYLHLVPQLIRDPSRGREGRGHDPYGSDFLELLAMTPAKIRESRLRRINDALRVAVPQLKDLALRRDEVGKPHLEGRYQHWRPKAGHQTEEQFSDGTLRLIGLLWALLDGESPLLLEEPELSLHSGVVRHLPSMMARTRRKHPRQVLLSTHSYDLLLDEGIAPEEVVLLKTTDEATEARRASDHSEVVALLAGGLSMAEAVLPATAPRELEQLALFEA